MSWDNEGQRLLIGCSLGTIQIWSYNLNQDKKPSEQNEFLPQNVKDEQNQVKFSICDDLDMNTITNCMKNPESDKLKDSQDEIQNTNIFIKLWQTKLILLLY